MARPEVGFLDVEHVGDGGVDPPPIGRGGGTVDGRADQGMAECGRTLWIEQAGVDGGIGDLGRYPEPFGRFPDHIGVGRFGRRHQEELLGLLR